MKVSRQAPHGLRRAKSRVTQLGLDRQQLGENDDVGIVVVAHVHVVLHLLGEGRDLFVMIECLKVKTSQ